MNDFSKILEKAKELEKNERKPRCHKKNRSYW